MKSNWVSKNEKLDNKKTTKNFKEKLPIETITDDNADSKTQLQKQQSFSEYGEYKGKQRNRREQKEKDSWR